MASSTDNVSDTDQDFESQTTTDLTGPCQIDVDPVTSRNTSVMVRDMAADQTLSESASKKFCRLSLDVTRRDNLRLCGNDFRSLSDSELDKTSSMTSEFLDLPRRLSERSSSLLLHRLDPEKLYLDLKTDHQSKHSNSGVRERSSTEPPRIQLSNIEVIVDNIEDESPQGTDMYFDNYSNFNNEDYVPRGSGVWINLEPHNHTLLSPRSSNGSICSYRSSNADSAIDMLTPDEELPEHSISDNMSAADCKLWEPRHRSRSHDLHSTSGSSVDGATHDCDMFNAISSSTMQTSLSSECSKPPLIPDSSSSPLSSPIKHSTMMTQHSHLQDFEPPSLESIQGDQPSNTLEIIQGDQTFTPVGNIPERKESLTTIESFKGERPLFTIESPQGEQPRPMPSVVISDFSSRLSADKGSQTSQTDLEEDTYKEELLGDRYLCQRSFSNSSISSESSLSIFSDSSDVADLTDFPIKLQRRKSSWSKIRNIVHWSPFIQQFKRRKYPWIQLAGHQGNFQAGEPGAILKKYDKREHKSFNKLMSDVLRPYVPDYRGEVEKNGDCYLQLQDLLCEFEAPCVMDIKMGCRTYLEEELTKAREKPTLRKDMYQKMIEVDPSAPTEEENENKAITKPRYMQWRDDMSSSVEMGFRIEGIRKSDGAQVKNFKTTKDKPSVKTCLKQFVEENPIIINKYLRRLKAIKATQESSPFFQAHEVIGSSLLFVHDKCNHASIWMIDFGKTVPLPTNVKVTHKNKWEEGNHEDGYLNGVDSLINIFEELRNEFQLTGSDPDESINRQDNESSSVVTNNTSESSSSSRASNFVVTDTQDDKNIQGGNVTTHSDSSQKADSTV